jgi:hypothetical protein
MLTPKATHLLIRHFDSLDRAVAKRLMRKRPWAEPALTSLLCDLLDSDTQADEPLDYPLSSLNIDLKKLEGLLKVSAQIQTHEYDASTERWVTQADLGLVINVTDHLVPKESWRISWLLQAKRLYPDSRNPLQYSEASRFGGIDAKQAQRIERLIETVQVPFVNYLLYCPLPAGLGQLVQSKLAYLRNRKLTSNIFDFALGQELYEDLGTAESTLAAGLFICSPEDLPTNLGEVHRQILTTCIPFSWFLASQLQNGGDRLIRPDVLRRRREESPAPTGSEQRADGIVSGEAETIKWLIRTLGETNEGPFPVLPRHTLTIDIEIGGDLDPEYRRIRED